MGVTAEAGVVTLTGQVPSYFDQVEAEQVAGRVVGVMGIAEELKVSLSDVNEHTDAGIAQAALNVLSWNVAVPRDQAKGIVEDGWVTLTGQVTLRGQARSWNDKEDAGHSAWATVGVSSVANEIVVTY
jgi:osmotically-inducible protein OsmY